MNKIIVIIIAFFICYINCYSQDIVLAEKTFTNIKVLSGNFYIMIPNCKVTITGNQFLDYRMFKNDFVFACKINCNFDNKYYYIDGTRNVPIEQFPLTRCDPVGDMILKFIKNGSEIGRVSIHSDSYNFGAKIIKLYPNATLGWNAGAHYFATDIFKVSTYNEVKNLLNNGIISFEIESEPRFLISDETWRIADFFKLQIKKEKEENDIKEAEALFSANRLEDAKTKLGDIPFFGYDDNIKNRGKELLKKINDKIKEESNNSSSTKTQQNNNSDSSGYANNSDNINNTSTTGTNPDSESSNKNVEELSNGDNNTGSETGETNSDILSPEGNTGITTRRQPDVREEIARIESHYDQQRQYVNEMSEQFSQFMNNIVQERRSYNLYRQALDQATQITATDPDAILAEYERKIKEIEEIHNERLRLKLAEIERNTAKLKQDAQKSGTADVSGLYSVIGEQSAGKEITKQKAQAMEDLQKEKREAFNKIKTQINEDNKKQFDFYVQKAAITYDQSDEEYYLSWVQYYDCCDQHIINNFSYENTGWIHHDCKKPYAKTITVKPAPTSEQLFQAAIRKYQVQHPLFQEATSDFIDMAINLNPNVAEYYYAKSFFVNNEQDKFQLILKTLSLDPSHVYALDEYDWYHTKKSGGNEPYKQYLKNHPQGIHSKEALKAIDENDWAHAKSINTEKAYLEYNKQHPDGSYAKTAQNHIGFFQNIKQLNQYIAGQDYENALNIYNQYNTYELFNKEMIQDIDRLLGFKDDKSFLAYQHNDNKYTERKIIISGYQEYLKDFPDGKHRAETQLRISELQKLIDNNFFSIGVGLGVSLISGSQNRPYVGIYGIYNKRLFTNYQGINIPTAFEYTKTGSLTKNLSLKYDLNFRYEHSLCVNDQSDSVVSSSLFSEEQVHPEIKTNISALNGTFGLWYKNLVRLFVNVEQEMYHQKVTAIPETLKYVFRNNLFFVSPGISLAVPTFNDKNGYFIVSAHLLNKETTIKYNVDPNTGAYYLDGTVNDAPTSSLIKILNSPEEGGSENGDPTLKTAYYVTNKISGFNLKAELMFKKSGSNFFIKETIGYLYMKNRDPNDYVPLTFRTYRNIYLSMVMGLSF